MKSVAQTARKTLDTLTADLAIHASRRLSNRSGYMPVVVERIDDALYSVAHYFTQNGDLIPDPEMVFWKASDGNYYPLSITQSFFGERRGAEYVIENGKVKVTGVRPREQREQASFAGTWIRNIRAQQEL